MLRATMSPGLYVQIAGRGCRMFPEKENCLFLDFGENILRHGPIDKIEIKRPQEGEAGLETAPMKECPNCHLLVFISQMICENCGHEFPEPEKHKPEASTEEILSKRTPLEFMDIIKTEYGRHTKKGSPDSMVVSYFFSPVQSIREWICIEHEGYAGEKAKKWIRERLGEPLGTVSDALSASCFFKEPSQIVVDFNDKFPRIKSYIFTKAEGANE